MPDDYEILSEDQEGVEGILPKYKTRYDEIWLFEETGEILLFEKKNHKVSVSGGLMASNMYPVSCAFETGAAPNLTREDLHEVEWLRGIQANNQPALKNMTNQKVSVVRTITLQVTMGDHTIRMSSAL